MHDAGGKQHFEVAVLAHLDAAYNLARWLLATMSRPKMPCRLDA